MAIRLAVDVSDERIAKLENWMWEQRIKTRKEAIETWIDSLPPVPLPGDKPATTNEVTNDH